MLILEKILSDKSNRIKLIKEFQYLIWEDENADKLLSELAYDLDFYEPDKKIRMEDPSYYGDERLEDEIRNVLQKLKNKT